MSLFQTVRPLDAAAFARLFTIELFWRTLLSVLFAVPPFLFCRRAQKRRLAVFSAALGSFLYAALLFAPMLAGFAYHEPVFILLPAPLYAAAGFLCLLCVYLRTTRPCKMRRFLSLRGSVALSLAAGAALHFIWYALDKRSWRTTREAYFLATPILRAFRASPSGRRCPCCSP